MIHPMKTPLLVLLASLACAFSNPARGANDQPVPGAAAPEALDPTQGDFVPPVLRPWIPWVLWRQDHRDCPPDFRDFSAKFCQWPTQLEMILGPLSGGFTFQVATFSPGWVFLPGRADLWPQAVEVSGRAVPVLPRRLETMPGSDILRPAIFLPAGSHVITGAFAWKELPLNLHLPPRTGILRLIVAGEERANATWDAAGLLWLRGERVTGQQAEQDFVSHTQAARVRDGIPTWFDTEIELVVTGRSREEVLGAVVPDGWQISQIEGPLPAIVDAEGNLRVQVRAGKWTLRLAAFQLEAADAIAFAGNARPSVQEMFVAWQADPNFRVVEIPDAPLVDPSQISFPPDWSNLPTYRWSTESPLALREILRGSGDRRAPPLEITRRWWLSQDGLAITTLDTIGGQNQELWRLDAAPGLLPGSVRLGEAGQLLTKNPKTGADGFEVRQRNFSYVATGTMQTGGDLPASGWSAEAENVRVNLNLPPGWRAFAVWGPDWVDGEWLSSWTLLDLFLLLIFTLAVQRLCGVPAAVVAFLAFVLFCHEPDAPKYAWLLLLIPIALLRVVPHENARRILGVCKWALAAILVLLLLPFFSQQIQQVLFPQLERGGYEEPVFSGFAPPATQAPAVDASNFAMSEPEARPMPSAAAMDAGMPGQINEYTMGWGSAGESAAVKRRTDKALNQNLFYEARARIQTGPGIPDWQWNTVNFGWNGPVNPGQTVELWLVSSPVQRALTVLRLVLILLLAGILLRRDRRPPPQSDSRTGANETPPLPVAAALVFAAFLFSGTAQAEMPDESMLRELRERLLAAPEVFPDAASIPSATLTVANERLRIEAQIHTAARCAVPLPARLVAWSPVSVSVNGEQAAVLLRHDDSLWVVLDPGIHTVRVEGSLDAVSEWQWSFLLKPLRVSVVAPGWSVGGVNAEGIPENQIFLVREERRERTASAYERPEFASVARVEREIELGLVWQVRTTVRRLSPPGRALSFELPLLPGEKVLDQNAVVRDGKIEIRLGGQQNELHWTSELGIQPGIALRTPAGASWVEEWRVLVSPVWNLDFEGIAPVYSESDDSLLPVWRPWPGESLDLSLSRPEALEGATVTVHRARQTVEAGQRLLSGTLELGVRASMGEEFVVGLPEGIEITSLLLDGKSQPVRHGNGQIALPLRPGDQVITASWRLPAELSRETRVPAFVLPVEVANITTVLRLPDDRWILWTRGPVRGPAVRFWIVLAASLLAAWILSRLPHSPIGFVSWALLGIGLTQVPYGVALVVVAWLFLLVWRGRPAAQNLPASAFNLVQIALPLLTIGVLAVFLGVVAAGLLGDPRMFILGNGSSAHELQWFEARSGTSLPTPVAFSISDGWYRFLMLAWALWLAVALLGWLRWGWQQYGLGGYWKKSPASPAKAAR